MSYSNALSAAIAGVLLQSALAVAEPPSPSVLTCDRLKADGERTLAALVATNGRSEIPVWYLFVAGRPEPGQAPKLCDPQRNNCLGQRPLPVDDQPVEVLTATADWSCIAADGRGFLWIASTNLKPLMPRARPELSDWLGHWVQDDDGYIDITSPDGRQLAIHGENKWHGLGDIVHTGEIQFSAVATSNPLKLADDGCEVTMTLVEGYLLLHDNMGCGGANVRFQGDWKRSSQPN